MKCPNCGYELKEGSNFCKKCGYNLQNKKKEEKEIEKKSKDVSNNKSITDEEIANKTEQKESKKTTSTFVENKEPNSSFTDKLKNKGIKIWHDLNVYEKIIAILCGICFVAFLIALIFNRRSSLVISIIQIVGLILSFLLEKEIVKSPNKKLKIIIPIICACMSTFYIKAFNANNSSESKDTEKIIWSELVLGKYLPEYKTSEGNIINNSDENLNMYIYNVSNKQYYEYLDECKKKGYDKDSIKEEFTYTAFNKDGYKLKLNFYEYSKQLDITLSISNNLGELKWSESLLAKLAPTPESKVGKILTDSDTTFDVQVGNISINDFKEYIKLCSDKGFNVEKEETDKKYYAKNADSYRITVEYEGNNTMRITVKQQEFNILLNTKFVENSTYDLKMYIDDYYKETLTHGESEEIDLKLVKGKHTIKFVNNEDENVSGKIDIDITKDQTINLEINCNDKEIIINNNAEPNDSDNEASIEDAPIIMIVLPEEYIGMDAKSVEKELRELGYTNIVMEVKKTTDSNNKNGAIADITIAGKKYARGDRFKSTDEVKIIYWEVEKSNNSVSYSTNDKSTVKNGNSGVYAYKSKGGQYDIYWIINFDEGYVYNFYDGNGDDNCDKIKIDFGNLNDYVKITWHDGGDSWSYGLHFKWKNQPNHLIVEDNDHFEYDYYSTNLADALKIRDKKTIKKY